MAAGSILLVLDWRIALISWGTFFIVSALTRYVSLGAITSAIAFPVSQMLIGVGGYWEVAAAAICAVLLIARHQPNIKRLVKGEESRFKFRKKKAGNE